VPGQLGRRPTGGKSHSKGPCCRLHFGALVGFLNKNKIIMLINVKKITSSIIKRKIWSNVKYKMQARIPGTGTIFCLWLFYIYVPFIIAIDFKAFLWELEVRHLKPVIFPADSVKNKTSVMMTKEASYTHSFTSGAALYEIGFTLHKLSKSTS
jgi:hypothetical protein